MPRAQRVFLEIAVVARKPPAFPPVRTPASPTPPHTTTSTPPLHCSVKSRDPVLWCAIPACVHAVLVSVDRAMFWILQASPTDVPGHGGPEPPPPLPPSTPSPRPVLCTVTAFHAKTKLPFVGPVPQVMTSLAFASAGVLQLHMDSSSHKVSIAWQVGWRLMRRSALSCDVFRL